MGRRVVFLESLHGIESLFTRGLRSGAAANGWAVDLVFLRDAAKERRAEAAIRAELARLKPDLVCFLMDAPLPWGTLWNDPALRTLPKFSFWFDDFVRSPETLRQPEVWRRWQREEKVSVFLHDGHWREAWARHVGGGAAVLPIDLSAEQGVGGEAAPLYPELKDHAVMIGTIPARASLDDDAALLPAPIREWIGEVAAALETAPWPLRPYRLAGEIAGALPGKRRLVLDRWLAEPGAAALAHHQIWRWGKRAARLRGLRALARRVPVAVLSGHRQERFAREEELRAEIAPAHDFVFHDTTGVPAAQWGGLFRSGGLQVQWVDPQSIESGAPFRLFEAAAAGVPLLSDDRPGFAALFAPEREMFFVPDEAALAEKAALLLAGPRAVLKEAAERACAAFAARHTWAHRWRRIEAALG